MRNRRGGISLTDSEAERRLDWAAAGRRIRERRTSAGLIGKQLAASAGISRAQLSNIERGGFGASLVTLVSIALALECSLDYLLGLDTAMHPDAARIGWQVDKLLRNGGPKAHDRTPKT